MSCVAWHDILCGTLQHTSSLISGPKHCRGFSSGIDGFFKGSDSLYCHGEALSVAQSSHFMIFCFTTGVPLLWGDNCVN